MANQNSGKDSSKFSQKNNRQNVPSPEQKKKLTKGTYPTQKNNPQQTRNEKRRRWAKKHKPVAKPVVQRGPEKEYVTACCGVLGRKPKAATKETSKDPETGKMKDMAKGLGHWRCTTCGKPAKVSPRKPAVKEITNAVPVASLVSPTNVI